MGFGTYVHTWVCTKRSRKHATILSERQTGCVKKHSFTEKGRKIYFKTCVVLYANLCETVWKLAFSFVGASASDPNERGKREEEEEKVDNDIQWPRDQKRKQEEGREREREKRRSGRKKEAKWGESSSGEGTTSKRAKMRKSRRLPRFTVLCTTCAFKKHYQVEFK